MNKTLMESRSTTDNRNSPASVSSCQKQPIKVADCYDYFRMYLDYNVPLSFSLLSLLVFLNKKRKNKTYKDQTNYGTLQQFSIECRKTKTKPITYQLIWFYQLG